VSATSPLDLARGAAQPATLFRASRPSLLLDYFRTPYAIAPYEAGAAVARLEAARGSGALLWPARLGPELTASATLMAGPAGGGIPLFGRILPDPEAAALLAGAGGTWEPVRAVLDGEGARLASIWRDGAGRIFLPFDPDEVVRNFWTEAYKQQGSGGGRARRALMRAYYRLRPLLPRGLQIALRRRFARVQARSRFPRWPAETALHDFYDVAYALLAEVAGAPVPRIAAWPDGHAWALVLTHDVEQTVGYEALDAVLEIERANGVRSAWNFVPRRYPLDDARLAQLAGDGWEVGVHGLYHDGRDLESEATLRERLPAIRDAAERWGAVGFRSPATHRAWELMPLLGFDHDSSYPDTDPYEPQAGGCCSWLPFFIGDLVELPLTLPQDHTLFAILRHADESAWVEKTALLRARGGMALMDTHPDYLVDERVLGAYERWLARFAGDATAWKALPRDVSAWWRRRAESRLERDGEGWQVAGPAAAEASVEYPEGTW
jgi:hypothetical protein